MKAKQEKKPPLYDAVFLFLLMNETSIISTADGEKKMKETSKMLISTARRIYNRLFSTVTSSIPVKVNHSQSELDLTLTKLNKSKIGKNNV